MDSEKRIKLEAIEISAPCPMSWNEMDGDDQVRFCNQCEKNVYDLSAMSRAEGEALLEQSESKLCVTYLKTADGKVLTDECPSKLRSFRDRFIRYRGLVAGFLAAICTAIPAMAKDSCERLTGKPVAPPPQQRMTGAPVPPQRTTGEAVAPEVLNRTKIKVTLQAQECIASNGEVFMSSKKHQMTGVLLGTKLTSHYDGSQKPDLATAAWSKWYRATGKNLFDVWNSLANQDGQITVTLTANPDGSLELSRIGLPDMPAGHAPSAADEAVAKALALKVRDTVAGARRVAFPEGSAGVKQVSFDVTFGRDKERFPRFSQQHKAAFWYDTNGAVRVETRGSVSLLDVKTDTPMIADPLPLRTLGRVRVDHGKN